MRNFIRKANVIGRTPDLELLTGSRDPPPERVMKLATRYSIEVLHLTRLSEWSNLEMVQLLGLCSNTLTHLTVYNARLQPWTSISMTLGTCSKLRSLDLSSCEINMGDVTETMRNVPQLERLVLGTDAFRTSIQDLAHANLRTLVVHSVHRGPAPDALPQLTELRVTGKSIFDRDAWDWYARQLRTFSWQSRIDATPLASFLRLASNLAHLSIQRSNIDDRVIDALRDGAPCLRTLDFSYCTLPAPAIMMRMLCLLPIASLTLRGAEPPVFRELGPETRGAFATLSSLAISRRDTDDLGHAAAIKDTYPSLDRLTIYSAAAAAADAQRSETRVAGMHVTVLPSAYVPAESYIAAL